MWKEYDNTDWDNWEYNPNDDGAWSSTSSEEEQIIVKDSNWNILKTWDTVAAIKDIPVKWGDNIKRWDKFKNIRLTDDVDLIESGKMVLRTEFFKKI